MIRTHRAVSGVFSGAGWRVVVHGLNVSYCYSSVCAGISGVSIAFRHRPSWLGRKSLLQHAASRLILLHLFLIHVLHDFSLSRFQRRGNSRLNVNKISFSTVPLLLPYSALLNFEQEKCSQPQLCIFISGNRKATSVVFGFWSQSLQEYFNNEQQKCFALISR